MDILYSKATQSVFSCTKLYYWKNLFEICMTTWSHKFINCTLVSSQESSSISHSLEGSSSVNWIYTGDTISKKMYLLSLNKSEIKMPLQDNNLHHILFLANLKLFTICKHDSPFHRVLLISYSCEFKGMVK